MTDPQDRQAQITERVLEQSLPKPGVAEAMRFWHYTRPLPAGRPIDTNAFVSRALDGEFGGAAKRPDLFPSSRPATKVGPPHSRSPDVDSRQAGDGTAGSTMSCTEAEVSAARDAMNKYRRELDGEIAAGLAVVDLSAERAHKEAEIRDDMIRVAHQSGASLRQLAEASGLGRKTVTATVEAGRTGR
ncbi:hypothetical protein [Candidatus Poriferisodalis sp.]|uniref:hypothetical protein n=1 Tax=Candidatus Poriferisodalis sp. TaxID=3101277 RepID=UPI003D0E4F6D